MPGRGLVTQVVNPQTLPEVVRQHLSGIVPLTQSVDDLEALIAQHEPQNKQVELEVFTSDLLSAIWNENNPYGPRAVATYWSINPAVLRGVLGQIRTALTEFVVELRVEIGEGGELPSAEQTDEALRSAISITGSTVTIMQATTMNGDIMPDGPRTTIKDNKISVSDVKGNVVAGSAHVTQTTIDAIDVAKIKEFAALVSQITPTLGFGPDEQGELETETDELQAAANDTPLDRGRIRRALSGVLKVLGRAGASAAKDVAVTMGDDLIRDLGSEISRSLPR